MTQAASVPQYSSPFCTAGPLLRPRSAPSGTRREKRLGLTDEADPNASSWVEVEESKVRVVSILDRVEYLSHLQHGLAQLSVKQSDELTASIKSRPRMHNSLKQNAPRIERMLETQRTLMRKSGTASKRLDRLHKYVVSKEKQRAGPAAAEAARSSAASFGGHDRFGENDDGPEVPITASASSLPQGTPKDAVASPTEVAECEGDDSRLITAVAGANADGGENIGDGAERLADAVIGGDASGSACDDPG